jgi:hypothetical protein
VPDPTATELFIKAIGITGPAALGTILGAIIKSLLDGKKPRTEANNNAQDARSDRAELKNDKQEGQIEQLKASRDELRYSRDTARTQRNRAWDRINAFEVQAGVPPSVWPADEPDKYGGVK